MKAYAVSSARQHTGEPEYAANQMAALRSWQSHFHKIRYVGPFVPDLASFPAVSFLEHEDWPPIAVMAKEAGSHPGEFSVLINADIRLDPAFSHVLERMRRDRFLAGTSKRFNFHPGPAPTAAVGKITDPGIDIFVANPMVWREVSRSVPPDFRIGHPMWDTWLLGWFNKKLGRKFVDFTDWKAVFHPIHQGRKSGHTIPTPLDKYMVGAALPARKL